MTPDEQMSTRELHIPPDSLQFREEGTKMFVEGLIVPYMKPADITEMRPDGPISYREQFAPGAFERASRAPYRVTFVYGHSDSLSERLGSGDTFADSAEGLIGTFRLDRSRAEQARDVLESSHGSLSVGFVSIYPKPWTEREGDLITRRSVHLGHVAAVPVGAYADARVLAMRGTEDDPEPTENERAEAERLAEEAELLEWVDTAVDSQRELDEKLS